MCWWFLCKLFIKLYKYVVGFCDVRIINMNEFVGGFCDILIRKIYEFVGVFFCCDIRIRKIYECVGGFAITHNKYVSTCRYFCDILIIKM